MHDLHNFGPELNDSFCILRLAVKQLTLDYFTWNRPQHLFNCILVHFRRDVIFFHHVYYKLLADSNN